MAHTAGGRKGRAIVGLVGLAPQRYYSQSRIAEIVGCTPSRVSDALAGLAESEDPKQRRIALTYWETAMGVGGRGKAGKTITKRRNR
jgi:uncharacterized protein YmfQ (DUF2313 family)